MPGSRLVEPPGVQLGSSSEQARTHDRLDYSEPVVSHRGLSSRQFMELRHSRMKYLPVIWAGLWRKPVRTTLTFLSLAAAFLLFGSLYGVSAGFDAAIERVNSNRLRVSSATYGPAFAGWISIGGFNGYPASLRP